MQLTEATERQVSYLQERGFGTRTDIVRVAIDRMYNTEKERTMQLSILLRQNPERVYNYVGTIWGDEPYTATAAEFADMLDELDYDGDMLETHPAYGGMAEGYYEQGNAIGYHARLIDEIVLEVVDNESAKEQPMVYFSAWQIHTEGLPGLLRDALNANRIKPNDVVWYGPSGGVVVADDVAHTEYDEYTDNETVAEWLDSPELL